MHRWSPRWPSLGGIFAAGLNRFPIAVAALAVAAGLDNLAVAGRWNLATEDAVVEATFALLGLALSATAYVLFSERLRIEGPGRHAISLLLACLVGGALLFWRELAVSPLALCGAVFLAVPLAPYLHRSEQGFWEFLWSLVYAAALAFIAVIIFCAGVSAILASLQYLFALNIGGSTLQHVWIVGMVFAGPFFALSLIPTTFPEHDAPSLPAVFVAGIRVLADFVVVPLLAAYAVVLHAYAVKIAVTGEVPKGQIGWMVLTFGLAVLATRVVVHPLAPVTRIPTQRFLRYWAVGLVVPLGLLFVAVWQRIEAYGVTPERYALALFVVFLGLVLFAELIPRSRGDIRSIPALGCLCLLVASVGPWGMIPVSARSQVERLIEHLAEANALSGTRLVTAPSLTRDAVIDIRSIVAVLNSTGQLHRLRPLFAGWPDDPLATPAGRAEDPRGPLPRIWTALNIDELPPLPGEAGSFVIAAGHGAVAVGGYDLVVPNLRPGSAGRDIAVPVGPGTVVVRRHDRTVEIESGVLTLRITPDLLREAVRRHIAAVEGLPENERPPLLAEVTLEGRKIGILFDHASGRLTESEFTLDLGALTLFLRSADWGG